MVVEVVAAQLMMLDVKLKVVVVASWVMAASKVTFLEQWCQVLVPGRLAFLLLEKPGYVVNPTGRQQTHGPRRCPLLHLPGMLGSGR